MRKIIPIFDLRMIRFVIICFLLAGSTQSAIAQRSFGIQPAGWNPEYGIRNTEFPADTTVKEKKHSPKTASIMSACLPGLGQIYNKKAWKLAIIYPALGGLGYGIAWNHHYFKYYRDALRIRYDGDSTTIDPLSLYSDDRIVTTKNYYQRYRDMCVIGFAAVYVLQILDAAVDAHLFYFDVGPDLSMRWGPVYSTDVHGSTVGLRLQLGFR